MVEQTFPFTLWWFLSFHIENELFYFYITLFLPVGLSDKRAPEEKQAIVDELFERYENEVAKCPEDHGIDLVCAYMLIEKSKKGTLS